ncbi:MAG: hypothetical protein LUD15_08695 [Bacteroides sp.]|nr:hypothetical protein [Bacteroides sp.]
MKQCITPLLFVILSLAMLSGCDIYSPTINDASIEKELIRYIWVIYEENYYLTFYSDGWGEEEYLTHQGWINHEFTWRWANNSAYNSITLYFGGTNFMELQSVSIDHRTMTCYIDGQLHIFAGI